MTYTMEIPDDARLEDGYIEFSGEPYLILQKRDDDGNIIAEKEIHETLENSEITSGCHGEEEEKKPVKSSLDERLVPYLEEFEEGYSDALFTEDPMDSYAGYDSDRERCESFFKKFKNNHNLNDDDINDLENEIIYRWQKEDAEIDHDMGEMYGNHYGDAEYFK